MAGAVVTSVHVGMTGEGRRVELRTTAFGEPWTLQYIEPFGLDKDQKERLRLVKTITLITEILRRNA